MTTTFDKLRKAENQKNLVLVAYEYDVLGAQ